MKKILIVIYDMRIGGAQKSLLSFLQTLSHDACTDAYEIDVMPFNPTGEFLAQIPDGIRIRQPENVLRWMGTRMNKELLLKHFSVRGLLGEAFWVISKKLGVLPKKGNVQQKLWDVWQRFIPELHEGYDVAISYIDGTANYYVIDKVAAKKKVLWLHNDYHEIGYSPEYDSPYYEQCDAIVTISQECKEAIRSELPRVEEKIHVLENITSCYSVLEKAQEGSCPEFADQSCLKLLTVGRLHEQKGLDIAIEAAKQLKAAGIRFIWLIVGEGRERKKLEEMVATEELSSSFFLIGSRENPYTYMRECDILVQTSRYEGRSIVLDEARMLNIPVVVTNYSTVYDAVVHEETGLIVDMNGEAVSGGIQRLAADDTLRHRIVENLQHLPKGNEAELQQYIEIMF